MVTQIAQWISVPALLIASIFSRSAGAYESLVDVAVCLAALVLTLRAFRSSEYLMAAGLVAVITAFSPIMLFAKIFLFMALALTALFLTLVRVFRPEPAIAA